MSMSFREYRYLVRSDLYHTSDRAISEEGSAGYVNRTDYEGKN